MGNIPTGGIDDLDPGSILITHLDPARKMYFRVRAMRF